MLTGFINYPAIRFKKPTPETLDVFYQAIYQKFKVEEDEGLAWKEECFEALIADDKERLAELQKQRGKLIFTDDLIDVLIDNYTRVDGNLDFEDYKDMILRAGYIKDIEFKENPKQIVFKTKNYEFKASELSDVFPIFKEFPGIETSERHGKCHPDSIVVSTTLQAKSRVATAYAYTFGEGQKFLHSWVEVKIDGRDFVIDTTRNLLMPRRGYYYIRNITGPVCKISKRTLEKEEPIYKVLHSENDWLIKLYLSNRHQALKVYKIIQQKKEQERMSDPLYVAAKHMHDSFEQKFEKEFKKKNKKSKSSKEDYSSQKH